MDSRRDDILRAALAVFLERGFDGATLAAIRERSGASTGSIYHFFGGKAEIAIALLQQAISGWALAATDAAQSEKPREAIEASVRGLLAWGRENPALFGFMDDLLARSAASAEFAAVAGMLNSGRAAAGTLYAGWAKRGEVRDIPWDLAHALIMGPSYAFLRNRRQGAVSDAEIAVLAKAAWKAVKP